MICFGALIMLGLVAALASMLSKGGTDEPIVEAHDCASCSSKVSGDCKIACLMEEKKLKEGNKTED
ncbi:hypothetical protein M1D30_11320 [Prevotella sp. E15-22]|uniref:hypothetical protein n=1 Tax=Prevotella sp. E15-22 TaxID=2937774 RepID=UPI0020703680|nr:hypothetical protein [Prevotella sp. E15-22]UPS44149.1 hypothetical protein M1D30_11320 [Prevotella sp. E15-22]